MRFLLLLAQAHEEFRAAELSALAELENVSVDLDAHDISSPFLELELPSEDHARRLVARSILVRGIYRLFAQGDTLGEVHAANHLHNFVEYKNASFKFDFMGFQGGRAKPTQIDIINGFAYMGLDGPIRMKNPEVTFTLIEQFEPKDPTPRHIWFTKNVGSSSRHLADIYNLKKRSHIGTTSFDAELALVTCNFAKVRKDDLVFDPFSGTGSFPVAAAAFGALVIGSDIDVRPLHGYDRNFSQYGTARQFVDVLAMDFTHSALRPSFTVDAIVCDPPYGVREGLKVCGSKDVEKHAGKEHILIDNVPAHLRRDYIQPKRPYEFDALLQDLLNFASEHLKPLGRLAFWMPMANEDTLTPPQHRRLKLVAACPQRFYKWTRYLLTYERRVEGDIGDDKAVAPGEAFRKKYFRGFQPGDL